MLSNYFRIAFRNLSKSRVHTTINLLGLTAGMVSVFLITLYLRQELSYDRFHEGAENIYRVDWYNQNPQTRTPHPLAQAMVADFPEVVSAVSLSPLWGRGLTRETHSFRNLDKDQRYDEQNILAVDTSFFHVFPFEVVKGNPDRALKNTRGGVMISESTAKRYFGDEDPIGKQLAVDSDTSLVEISGVFKDVPVNSHFHFDFLVSYLREKYGDPEDSFYSWADFGHYNYIRLVPGTDAKQLEGKMMNWIRKYIDISDENFAGLKTAGYGFRLTPITDIHLHSHINWELEPNGNISYVYILATAGLLTLVIACVNFMNLTTARSTERAKEIGVRKSLGAVRKQLATQFIFESVLISLAAVILSLVVIQIAMPVFNSMTGANLSLEFWPYGVLMFAGGLLIGVFAGLYPSFYLSRIKPSAILKGSASVSGGSAFRNLLIGFQFAISMALISGSIIIFNQLEYLQNHALGYDKNGVLVVPLKAEEFPSFDAMRSEISKISGVTDVSATTNIPGGSFNQFPIFLPGRPMDIIAASQCYVDPDFFKTMNITLKEGRLFTRGSVADTVRTFVINQAAADQLNMENPVGGEISIDLHDRILRGRVIGVVNNFNFQSLHDPLRPLIFHMTNRFNYMIIRADFNNLSQKIAEIETIYRKFDPIFDFEFSFLDDRLQNQYVAESRLGVVMGLFSGIAIVIASFGLFGMALLNFYRKTKEISIRKVLGAGVPHLIFLLLKNFTILVLIAIVVATPFTWWVMSGWLENFSFRIEISPLVFIGAAVVLIAICWLTLSYLTLKTTRLNPAETLKRE